MRMCVCVMCTYVCVFTAVYYVYNKCAQARACAFVCVSAIRAKSVLGDGVTTLDAIPAHYSGRRYGGATARTTNEALRTLRRRSRGRLYRDVPIDSYV